MHMRMERARGSAKRRSSKIKSRKVFLRLSRKNFSPRKFLAIRYLGAYHVVGACPGYYGSDINLARPMYAIEPEQNISQSIEREKQ